MAHFKLIQFASGMDKSHQANLIAFIIIVSYSQL